MLFSLAIVLANEPQIYHVFAARLLCAGLGSKHLKCRRAMMYRWLG